MTMELTLREISSKSVRQSSLRLTTKNAWARYVRRRWPNNTLAMIMAEFDLSEGRARGVLYAQITQSTIDAIIDHPRGGFALGLEILVIKTGINLEQFIELEAEEAANERARWEARELHLAGMEARLRRRSAERRGLDREAAE